MGPAALREESPYRALEVTAKTWSLATPAKPDPVLAAVPTVFGIAAFLSLLIHADAAATVAGTFAGVFALARWIASRVRAPLLHADRGGLRLCCRASAQLSAPALSTSSRVDLMIPWAECERVAVETRVFVDGLVAAVVITTPARTIAVRADIFDEPPAKIVECVAAARAMLAAMR